MDVPIELLRRPYTRTISKDIRSIPVLAASFADVEQQWFDLLLEQRNADIQDGGIRFPQAARGGAPGGAEAPVAASCDNALLAGAKHALAATERIVSQLKAVKQELVVHLNAARRQGGCNTAEAEAAPRPLRCEDSETVFDPAAMPFFTHLTTSGKRTGEVSEKTGGERREGDGPCSLLRLARGVWLWSVLFGCTIADMDLLSGSLSVAQHELFGQASAVRVDAEAAASDITRFFFSNRSASKASSRAAASPILDALFVAACSLLYNVVTHDASAAAQALVRWTAFSEALADPTLTSHQLPSSDEGSLPVGGSQVLLLLARRVPAVAAALAAEDYGAAGAILQGYAADCGSPSASDGEGTDDDTDGAVREAKAFLLGIQLLVRTLTELDVRRSLIKAGIGNAYRPVILSEEHRSDKGDDGGAVRFSAAVLEASQADAAECSACCQDPPSALVDSDGCLAHWPRRIQLQRLQDVGGPWPLPANVVQTQFTFLLPCSRH